MKLEPVGNSFTDGDLLSCSRVTHNGDDSFNHLAFQVTEIVSLINSPENNAHEILVGLEDGTLVGDKANALYKWSKSAVRGYGFAHFTTIDCGIVII